MTVSKKQGASVLQITYSNGVDEKGKERKKSRSYSQIRPNATDEAIYNVATALIGLQSKKALEVHRKENAELVEA
jgi:hypothetical protein